MNLDNNDKGLLGELVRIKNVREVSTNRSKPEIPEVPMAGIIENVMESLDIEVENNGDHHEQIKGIYAWTAKRNIFKWKDVATLLLGLLPKDEKTALRAGYSFNNYTSRRMHNFLRLDDVNREYVMKVIVERDQVLKDNSGFQRHGI
uniref:SPK domain-containing protein n=1 Tax=Caenorhabditis tropicalis TaxID=1561998 RepID=A0A1I7UVE2_9PELO